jgi:galactonate dehydratase
LAKPGSHIALCAASQCGDQLEFRGLIPNAMSAPASASSRNGANRATFCRSANSAMRARRATNNPSSGGVPFAPEINFDRKVLRDLRTHLEAIRDGAGPDVDILLDLNFNAKTEGYLKILRTIADLDMVWVEIDSFNPEALGNIRRQSPHPVSSCETLLGLREFLPYFREQAIDVAIIDTPWNGVWQSMKIASAAEAYEVNVAPHNFYGHLCTMMNAHFSAAVPNLRIMETDIDRLAWDQELFSHVPEIEEGHLIMPDRPGWGTEPNEDALRAHPPKGNAGLLNYGQKA